MFSSVYLIDREHNNSCNKRVHKKIIIIGDLSEIYRRPIGDPSKTYRRPTCLIGDPT